MPMDYDDKEFHIHNVLLAGEGSSTVSLVLRPYALPKFDYGDSLQGHLKFDSLVENEVFLGITGQEDNQWIEEYSRASTGIEFSSSVAESRRNNVWSEATSSESVEMLLKSVGQEEEGVLEETVTEGLDVSDELGSIATDMDPNLKQHNGNDHVIHAQKDMVTNKPQDIEESHTTSTTQSQEAKISDGDLESVVLGTKCNLSGEKLDSICDDIYQDVKNLAVELVQNKLQEDLSTSKVECGDTGSTQNCDASKACDLTKKFSSNEAEYSIKNKETSMDNPTGSDTAVETSNYSDEKPSVLSNVKSLDKPSFEVGIPVNEQSTSLMSIKNCNLLTTEECKACESSAELSHDSKRAVTASPTCSEMQELNECMHENSLAIPTVAGFSKLQEIEDNNIKTQIFASPEPNVSSPSKVSDVQSRSVGETENANGRDAKQATRNAFEGIADSDLSEMGVGSNINDVGTNLTNACSSAELLAGSTLNTDLVASDNTPKAHSGDSNDKDQSPATKLSGSVQVNDEIRSSEQSGICMDQDVTFEEGGNARLPTDCNDMDSEVVGALDIQKNVETTSSADGCKGQRSEADMTILEEPVAAVISDMVSSPDTSEKVHLHSGSVATDYIVAKSPILEVSSVHHDTEKKETGFLSDGTCENEPPKVTSMVDCASEGPLYVVEKGASPDHVGKVIHGMSGHSAPSVENINEIMSKQAQETNPSGLGCSTTSMTNPLPSDSSPKLGDNIEAGDLPDPMESTSGHHREAPLSLAVNMSAEHQASTDVAPPSECDDSHTKHHEDISAYMDTHQSVSPLKTSNTELSQSAKVTYEMAEAAICENASLRDVTEDVEGKVQSVASNSDMKREKSFTFEVGVTAGFGQTGKDQQLFPAIQACNMSKNMEGSSINSTSSILDPKKPNEVPLSATIQVGAKGNSECKSRRKSVGKESVKKGNRLKETTPRQSGRVEKSSVLLTSPATDCVVQFEAMKPKEKVECSITKPSGILPAPTSNLPDLNNATSIFQQPFTDRQQVQLRAQILVYGSLISGTLPDETHMIAAFGETDAARKTWKAVWHACVKRVHGQKSLVNTPSTPMQSRSDAGHRTPDPGTKLSSIPSKVLYSPIGGGSNKGTPPVVSPLIPLSSPLWNISTPSSVGLPSSGMPRSALLQSFSPLHPYQTPPVHNLSGYNPPWLSQGPFSGQWVSPSPVSAFNAAPRLSALPITEAVKLTPVKVSGGPGIKHTYSIPVVHSAGSSGVSVSDAQKATVSSGQVSSDSKSRKRKKVNASVTDQTSIPSQALMTSVTEPPIAHLPLVPRAGAQNRISLLVENQTDSFTAHVVSSIFSTSVTVSTPDSITSKSSPGRFLSVSSTHDHPRFGDKKVGNVVISEDTLNKVEEGKVLAENANVHAASFSDSKSIKRKKVTTSLAVNHISVIRQAPVASVTAPVVAYLPQVLGCEGCEISLLAQNQTDSVAAPAVCSSFLTPVAISTPVSITSKSSPGRFLKTVYPASTYGYGYQNMENAVAADDTLSKVKEYKLQAENAALIAAAEVSNCQGVWSQLERQISSGVVSDAEAKLMSSAVSIAAAATVAKMAAAAAKIASNVAEQAQLMADEVFLSRKTENFNQSSIISHPNVVNKFDKATPASILKGVDKTNHPNSIISAAREAARRRIEAASAASKHAENLDAIVKAAELASEAVSQVGKILAMGDSSALRKLVEAGPEGYWNTSQLAYDQQGEVLGHLNNSGKKNVEAAPNVFVKEIQSLRHGLEPQEHPVHLAENQMMVIDGLSGSITSNEKDTRMSRTHKAPSLSKSAGVASETETGSLHTYVAEQNTPHSISGVWEEHNIKEGCLVEVYKEDGKYKGAWLAANVLSLKDEKALVCYTEIQSSEEGSEKLKEWVPLEVEVTKVPRIRIAHPMTTMRFEGTRKRRRTALTDYAWSNGDKIDVWMQDCWREGVVIEPNKIDITFVTVQFPAHGETSIVRSWHVRPTLIWEDKKWIEWSSLKAGRASEGEMPKEKRIKLGSPAVKDKMKAKLPKSIEVMESGRHEESGTLPLSALESSFDVGKITRGHENKLKTIRSGLHKEGAGVIFGVPKPGKKQKFMDVSKHYVAADGSNKNKNKNNTTNDSIKFSKYVKPQAPVAGARGWKINSKSDSMENQVPETKSRRKPPVPSFRKLTRNDNNNLIPSKPTTHDSSKSEVDSVEYLSRHQNQMEVGSSSNNGDAAKAPKKAAFSFTSSSDSKSEHFNEGKVGKVEVKDKAILEPRRSNRRIRPTSRLLEGLQSSLTISKISSPLHANQRNHNNVTSKGNTNYG